MLICRTCGGGVVVDNSERAVISNGDLWYHTICIKCREPKGMLANVESEQLYDIDQLEQERIWEQLQQKPSSC